MSDIALPDAPLRLPRPLSRREREPVRETTLDRWLASVEAAFVVALARQRTRELHRVVRLARRHAGRVQRLSDDEIRALASTCGRRMAARDEPHDREIAWAFALVREASARVLGKRHHDVQLVGGHALLRGMIAEMNTGEGKTLTAALAAVTAALSGTPVHVVSVNDYLVSRDAEHLRPLYSFFGLSVGTVVHGQAPAERAAAYRCHVTYCSNKELAFDYLRDGLATGRARSELRTRLQLLARSAAAEARAPVMRGLHFAIVDEADSVLIDEARTPLILSRNLAAGSDSDTFAQALELAGRLSEGRDYRLHRDERRVELTAAGQDHVADRMRPFGGRWASRTQREELATQALTALHLMTRDEHYLVRDGKVQIIDEYTGRVMPDRFWNDGLHQLIELKEGCELSDQRVSLARMTYQRFFRRYLRLSGMTGTADEVASELWRVYRLPVARIPPNRRLRRQQAPDRVFATAADKWRAVTDTCRDLHRRGLPVLIGTRSVAASNEASAHLTAAGIDHLVLNAAQDESEAAIVARAGEAGRVTVATNMAGRGTDIILGDGVAARGGLHVVMTERHDSRRIDRQLAGRSARQGDPGWFGAFLSLEDPLLETLRSPRLLRFARLLFPLVGASLGRRLIVRAQLNAERQNARTRAELLAREDSLDRAMAFSGRPE